MWVMRPSARLRSVMSSEMPSRYFGRPLSSGIAIFLVRSSRSPLCGVWMRSSSVICSSPEWSTARSRATDWSGSRLGEKSWWLRAVAPPAGTPRARHAEQLLACLVEQNEAVLLGLLDEQHGRDVLDHGVEEGAGLAQLALGAHALRYVEHRDERGGAPLMSEGAGEDFDADEGAVRLGVLPLPTRTRLDLPPHLALDILAQLRRPNVEDRHRQELLAAVAVMFQRGVVGGEEAQARAVVPPHRQRVAVKEKSERRLAPLEVGDVDPDADGPAVP